MTERAAATNENPQHAILFFIANKEMVRVVLVVCSSDTIYKIVALYERGKSVADKDVAIMSSLLHCT